MNNSLRLVVIGFSSLLTVAKGLLAARAERPGINPYRGRQVRDEVFRFAERPRVATEGDRYVITFATTARCDVTVAVVGPEGKIVRHVASGALGPNAPWPFQQDTLRQRIVWDGRDDAGRPVPPGCQLRVWLGLQPAVDKIFGWCGGAVNDVVGLAVDDQGQLYVLGAPNDRTGNWSHVRVFDRQGGYLRTIMPHPATVVPERMTLIDR